MKSITLIWQMNGLEYVRFEFEWTTKVVFASFDQKHIIQDQYQTVEDGAVIIYSCNERKAPPELIHYLKRYEEANKSFYLLHLSNENLNHDAWYYSKAKHVFRNYVDPVLLKLEKNVISYLPLGFQTGYKNYSDMINLKPRKHPFAFIGQVKSDRKSLVKVIESVPNSFLHLTQKWNCPTALKPHEVCDIYANTNFVPCPKGWSNPDSFRICEALEWGAIPILKRYDAYSYLWLGEKHPIPMVDDWKDIPKLLSIQDIGKLRMVCWHWYTQMKSKLALDVIAKIED